MVNNDSAGGRKVDRIYGKKKESMLTGFTEYMG
jgi:hypothetical protein